MTALNRQQRRAMAKAKPRNKPAKRHTPSGLLPFQLLSLNRPYTDQELLPDIISLELAAKKLMDGSAEKDDFNRLATAFNLAALVALDGNPHLTDITQPVTRALISMRKRYEKWGKWDLTQAEKEQLQIGLDLNHELMRHSTPLKVQRAAQRLANIRNNIQ